MQFIVNKIRNLKVQKQIKTILVITLSLLTLSVVAGNTKLGKNMTNNESLLNELLVKKVKSVVQKQHKTPIAQFEIVKVEKKNWPNSALGCPKAGMQYMQVITPGFLVYITANGIFHEVHTSDKHAVFCGQNKPDSIVQSSNKKPKIEESTLKRIKAIQLSRAMLVKTKEIEAKKVRLKSVSDASINDFDDNCKNNYSGEGKGFKVVLTHHKTEIVYFSDGQEVVKCKSHTAI